jgi:hypothetical protein
MRRVAANADLIAERLCSRGWRALSAGTSDLRTLPAPADADILCRIENITGAPIPPTLLAFWKIVGGVNWVWDYETGNAPPDLGVGLPMQEMDPLCVDPPKAADYLFDEWEDQRRRPDPDLVGSFELELAPDYLHKANISGGAPYSIALPFLGADPKLANESHGLPFVDYLRLCFRWAGFPGLEGHARRDDVRNFIAEFTAGLAPF